MSKYKDMKEQYEQRICKLTQDVEFWRNKYSDEHLAFQSASNRSTSFQQINLELSVENAKVELYEKLLNKILGEKCTTTDSMFMFEGECYQPMSFTLNREKDAPDTLSVEFLKYPFGFMKKEE